MSIKMLGKFHTRGPIFVSCCKIKLHGSEDSSLKPQYCQSAQELACPPWTIKSNYLDTHLIILRFSVCCCCLLILVNYYIMDLQFKGSSLLEDLIPSFSCQTLWSLPLVIQAMDIIRSLPSYQLLKSNIHQLELWNLSGIDMKSLHKLYEFVIWSMVSGFDLLGIHE